jgi:GAF domain-containing protein
MNTVETRTRTTSTHPAIDASFAAAARLAREATARRTTPQACRAIVDALSMPALGFGGIALLLDRWEVYPQYQVVAGSWPPQPNLEPNLIFTIPLLLDDKRMGELTVYKTEGTFEEAEAALITSAAAHAALGVARARLIEEVAQLREEIGSGNSTASGGPRTRESRARKKNVGVRKSAARAGSKGARSTRKAAASGSRKSASAGARKKRR